MALILNVKVHASTLPDIAAAEMCELADATQCIVQGIVGGGEMSARPADRPEEVLEDYHQTAKDEQPSEAQENLAWATRVLAASDATTTEKLLATALVSACRELLRK